MAEESKYNRGPQLPIQKKAGDILETTRALIDTIPEEGPISEYRRLMMEDAYTLSGKIANAEGGGLFSLKLENAYLVKIAARNLQTHTSGLKMMGHKEDTYRQVLRDELDEFRVLLHEWVSTFKNCEDIRGEWDFEHLLGLGHGDEPNED